MLELQDAFPKWANKENAALNCKAVVLNINLGYNKEVMEKCKKLKEYAQYIARVRKYLEAKYDIEAAIDKATDECIAEGIKEGISKGVVAVINTCKSFGISKEEVEKRLAEDFALEEAEAHAYIEKYWEN